MVFNSKYLSSDKIHSVVLLSVASTLVANIPPCFPAGPHRSEGLSMAVLNF